MVDDNSARAQKHKLGLVVPSGESLGEISSPEVRPVTVRERTIPKEQFRPMHQEVNLDKNVLTIRGVKIDLAKLRDTFIYLRSGIYCPICACPNWVYEEGQRVDHHRPCAIGEFSEALLRIFPKDHVRVYWKND